MQIAKTLDEIRNDRYFCKYCMKITDFQFEVVKNTTYGQYTGSMCPLCNRPKGVKFTPFKSKKQQDWFLNNFRKRS